MTVAVVGYASIDSTICVDRFPQIGVTSRVVTRFNDGLSRPGGIAHTALALADAGVRDVFPICAVAADTAGKAFVEALEGRACQSHGIEICGDRSPNTILIYGPDLEAACLFDPGNENEWRKLSASQRKIVASCDLLISMVGPAAVTSESLELLPEGVPMVWIVKDDPGAVGSDVAYRLGRRVSMVFHNYAEAEAVSSTLSGSSAITVRTNGPEPVAVVIDGDTRTYPIPPVEFDGNPTGAGDSFAGGYLAAWLAGDDSQRCVAAGAKAAAKRLRGQS